MNERTAKLINAYATRNGQKGRDLKREWNRLSAKERAVLRRKMAESLATA